VFTAATRVLECLDRVDNWFLTLSADVPFSAAVIIAAYTMTGHEGNGSRRALYLDLNGSLWNAQLPVSMAGSRLLAAKAKIARYENLIECMTIALGHFRPPPAWATDGDTHEVYRGIEDRNLDFETLNIGEVRVFHGFTSASTSRHVALRFTRGAENGVVFAIRVPPHLRSLVAFIQPVSFFQTENECLLPPRVRVVVDDVTGALDGHPPVVTVTLLPPGQATESSDFPPPDRSDLPTDDSDAASAAPKSSNVSSASGADAAGETQYFSGDPHAFPSHMSARTFAGFLQLMRPPCDFAEQFPYGVLCGGGGGARGNGAATRPDQRVTSDEIAREAPSAESAELPESSKLRFGPCDTPDSGSTPTAAQVASQGGRALAGEPIDDGDAAHSGPAAPTVRAPGAAASGPSSTPPEPAF
jgi:hypothetical protein